MTLAVPIRIGPAEAALIAQLRATGADELAARLTRDGLPTRKVERYHYTDLKVLLREVPERASVAAAAEARFGIPGAVTLVAVNGVWAPPADLPAGVTVRIGAPGTPDTDDILAGLNHALAGRGAEIAIAGTVTPVLQIDRGCEGEAGHAADWASLDIAPGARATIIETFTGSDAAHLANHASRVKIGAGAEITHIVVDLASPRSTNFATLDYRVAAGAKLRTITIHAGSMLSRINISARLEGEGAHGDFTGLNLVSERQHSDVTLELTHAVPHCTSKPLYKQVAHGRSTAAFQGKIVVARNAQKTDAKLMMQGLVLSDESQILSKPELEIFADDVVCGHGATVGALDDEAIFYLLSRGIARAEAEAMLVHGFLEEVLDPLENEALKARLTGVVEDWLQGRDHLPDAGT